MQQDIAGVVKEMVKDHVEELRAFSDVVVGPFVQDKEGWTDPETKEFYPPTMDYLSHLRGWRISDNTNFAVNVRLQHEMVEGPATPQMANYVATVIFNAILSLASYSDCACTVQRPCGKPGHGMWSKQKIESP